MQERINKIRQLLENADDAVVILRPENRRYISGFTGSSGLVLITKEAALLITDFRYTEQATSQAPDYQIVEHRGPILKTLAQELTRLGINRLAFEQDFVTYNQYVQWTKDLPVALMPVEGWVEGLRVTKDEQELVRIKRSVEIADQAFDHILKFVKPGLTELEVAIELEFFMRRQGAEGLSFESIVASGERASLPHAEPTEKKLAVGELLTMDFGCVYQGYCSDITRTIALGQVNDKQREIYQIVLKAQEAALGAVKPGLTGQQVDKVARDIITEAGYGENFGHGLGHGVGLVVHENPRFSQLDQTEIAPGMVMTVEPGIYIPGWSGVRIEDMVVVTEAGCQILTQAPKELIVL